MPKIMEKVTTNVKDRFEKLRSRAREEVDVLKGAVSELTELKPVPAVVHAVTGTVDTVGDAIVDQALITRRWIER